MNTKLTRLFVDFFESGQSSGILLLVCMVASIALANSPLGDAYADFWHLKIGIETLNLLRQEGDGLHSRKLRSFDEPPLR